MCVCVCVVCVCIYTYIMVGTILFSDFLSSISMQIKIQKRPQCKIIIKLQS